ncbi:MAG: MarR family transcriptional regulator [Hyphomicrobium sp.]|nr:MarR family transcriptional regulator [Hyphomicrobium sp.]
MTDITSVPADSTAENAVPPPQEGEEAAAQRTPSDDDDHRPAGLVSETDPRAAGPLDQDPHGQAPRKQGDLVAFAELLYFAYRNFTSDPDAILARYRFGRAHHRVLHFVHRNPGLKVAELLDILQITKQSLARVLKELRDKGFIAQRPGPDDLRERRLYATSKGARLAQKLMALQVKRIGEALAAAGQGAEDITHRFLIAMIAAEARALPGDDSQIET